MSNLSPFAVLADYARRSKQSAQGLPAQLDIKSSWSGVGFRLAGQRMVAPMGEVVEILKVPNFTRLPSVQPWVEGVANVRGRLLPLFDLEAFCGGHLAQPKQRNRVLVIEMGELYAGLIVSEVYGMQHFMVDSYTESVPEALKPLQPYIPGAYEQMDWSWVVFSPYLLARDPRFFNAAVA